MSDSDLVFRSLASGVTTDLVFGADENIIADSPLTVTANFEFAVDVNLHLTVPMTVTASFDVEVSVRPAYVSGASRPLVGKAVSPWHLAIKTQATAIHESTAALPLASRAGNHFQHASRLASDTSAKWTTSLPLHSDVRIHQQDAVRVLSGASVSHKDSLRVRSTSKNRFQQGLAVRSGRVIRHQDTLHDRRNRTAGRWQGAMPKSVSYTGSMGSGQHLDATYTTRYQEAMKPPPGIWDRTVVVPPKEPCYIPDAHLLFKALLDGSANLIFKCDGHGGTEPPDATVVVPIKRVYVVLNETSLRRVDGNIPLPTLGMSMTLDVDSWTWSFNASLPGRALADLEPATRGELVLVEAMINGVAYRMQIDDVGRDRSFNQSAIKISGKGRAAVLDSPTAPIMNFTNSEARTAQQLMNDVLTLGGVSIGWEIDYRAIDWAIPAGLFSHQGSYISAINAIAEAAGSYVQPHRVNQTLIVLPRYPDLPWNWGAVTPDYEIPSAVATVEATKWTNKPMYNRVYVSGISQGVLGQVTRAGTAGDLVAPMVTNPLITTAAAARQRGTPILADTGAQRSIALRMPVLAETGIIVPGKYVRYTDDPENFIGLTRSVSLDVATPEVWQTIAVETHVQPV